MRSDFDALRDAPLPDSFAQTAAWLRASPPPRRSPRAPLLALAVAACLVAACSLPVDAPLRLGAVVEATADDALALVAALDRVVPAEARLQVEVEPAGDGRSAVRYVVLDDDGAARHAADAARGMAGVTGVRLSPLDATVRQPLGLVAARRVGVSANPRLSDAELQAALDRAFAGHGRLVPRVGRDPQGRRVAELTPEIRFVLPPDVRVVRRGTDGAIGVETRRPGDMRLWGVPLDSLVGPDGRIRPGVAPPGADLDVLSPAEAAAFLDSSGASPSTVFGRADSLRVTRIRLPR